MTPQVGKWYMTRERNAVKILSHDQGSWMGSNDEVYYESGNIGGRQMPEDLLMDLGPIEPTTEELALYALGELWTSRDNAGGAAFRWTPEEVSAVKDALTKAGRLKP